jgi:hypothetical protein
MKLKNIKAHAPSLVPWPPHSDKITLTSWTQQVKFKNLIDYDGHGYLATKAGVSDAQIRPSDFTTGSVKIPSWVTHICWFNR